MPKRRPGGPSPQNRRRRRRDAAPNLPRDVYASPDDAAAADEAPRPAQNTPAGRSLRPTMRRGFVPGATRIAPQPALEVDYRYVIQDLRQIGILAGAGILILVGLSFFLQ